MIEALIDKLTRPVRDTRSTTIFSKALVLYFGIKIVFTWKTLAAITAVHSLSYPRSIGFVVFGIGAWGASHIHIFLSGILIVLITALILKPNYILAALVAWLALNFNRVSFPVANGSDQIMVTLLFLAIPLSARPLIRNEKGAILQSAIYNTTHLFCLFYVASVYLISGLDKLGSEGWRSGDAIGYISRLDYMVNPDLKTLIPVSEGGRLFLAWLTLLFELSFPVLVWFRKTKKWTLVSGIIFHAVIGFFLSLPDFAWIMIISYLIFLTAEDINAIRILRNKKIFAPMRSEDPEIHS